MIALTPTQRRRLGMPINDQFTVDELRGAAFQLDDAIDAGADDIELTREGAKMIRRALFALADRVELEELGLRDAPPVKAAAVLPAAPDSL